MNNAIITNIATAINTIFGLMKQYGVSYTRKEYIPLDDRYAFGRYVFDNILVAADGLYMADMENMMRMQGCSDEDIEMRPYTVVGAVRMERVPEDLLLDVLFGLNLRIDIYSAELPKRAKENAEREARAKARREFEESLPFMEKYYLRQYGVDAYEKAFGKRVPRY